MEKVIISGGTGLIGTKISRDLKGMGYQVVHLSRSNGSGEFETKTWDPRKNFIEDNALHGADHIINLAGANVAGGLWTNKRKKLILESRIQSTATLVQNLMKLETRPKTFVSASAIGYYGYNNGNRPITEEEGAGSDFLAQVTQAWEDALMPLEGHEDIRTVKLRIGMVLSSKGGALPVMSMPFKAGLGSALGSGKQIISWIHLDDLSKLFIHTIQNQNIKGAYNAVSSQSVSNYFFSKTLANSLNRPFFLPNVPAFLLRTVLGEMANIVLGGSNVSNEKIRSEGFKFKYEHLEEALTDLTKKLE